MMMKRWCVCVCSGYRFEGGGCAGYLEEMYFSVHACVDNGLWICLGGWMGGFITD